MSWKAEFSVDNGETWSEDKPEWVCMETAGQGGKSQNLNITIAPQNNIIALNKFNKSLQDAELVGTEESPVDLSNGGETANCYIVNAAGYYKLPLIIGNGRDKSGVLKTPNGSESFVNYKGSVLKSPEDYTIQNADNCTLAWQDVENLVSNLHLSEDKKFLEFYIDPATILTGNAILAVRDSENNIIWSWHIWSTPYNGEDDIKITNSDTKESFIMPLDLGWAEGQNINYKARSIKVRFSPAVSVQEEVEPIEIEINQKGESLENNGGRTVYYQWGRKDPMLPSTLNDQKDVEQYGPTDLRWETAEGSITIETAIANPNVFYCNEDTDEDGNWFNGELKDLWNYNSIETESVEDVVKTIYDPSPVGYHIPKYDILKGIKLNNNKLITVATSYCSECLGLEIPSNEATSLFLQFSTKRKSENGKAWKPKYMSYWVASVHNKVDGRDFYFKEEKFAIDGGCNCSYGLPVRPVRDF